MLFTVNRNSEGFVLSIAHTKNDDTEINNLDSIDPKYLSCCKVSGGMLVIDENKKKEADEEEEKRKEEEEEEKLRPTVDDLAEALNTLTDIVLGGNE